MRTLPGSSDVDLDLDPTKNSKEFFYSAQNYFELKCIQLRERLNNDGTDVTQQTLKIEGSKSKISKFMHDNFLVSEGVSRSGKYHMAYGQDVILAYEFDGSLTEITILGSKEIVSEVENDINDTFDQASAYIKWIYDPQYLESMIVPVQNKNNPFTEMYPFLGNESLEDYYDRFIDSDASILLLIGPPGTGKTSMLRGLLQHTGQNAILTYHTKLLESDSFFAEWFQSNDENIVIMEDSDTLLLPRTDGNTMMSRFLNLGDGLITMKGKKMIFSTNLPNVGAIDEALTRPGRCHDILEFRSLTRSEALKVANKVGVELKGSQDSYTIAEIFSDIKTRKQTKQSKNKFGFI